MFVGNEWPARERGCNSMTYHIKDVWRCGVKRWLVMLDDKEVARFELKREAIAWIISQEAKKIRTIGVQS